MKEYIYLQKVIIVQAYYRGRKVRNNRLECNNEEDFYTYEKIKDPVSKQYLYCYRDSKNIKWGFDIRSLKKLIDMNYDNPYTTEKIPDNIGYIIDVNNKINILMKGEYEDLDNIIEKDKKIH